MDLTTSRNGGTARVSVTGDVDSETSPQFESELMALLDDGVSELVVDPSGIDFLSSAGLSVLITAHTKAERFRLERGNRTVDRLIELTGLGLLYDAGGPGGFVPGAADSGNG
jgi:anti-sigma B factor antagonist